VRESYADPLRTVQTNVLGTTHLLELARTEAPPAAVVLVTSDKCYENREWVYPYREEDRLGGSDLYSMSKAGAELAASAYRRAFFPPERLAQHGVAVATARAGNVFGGGDWAADRLVPDCFRALLERRPIVVRSPGAVRPWQHVLEPLSGYLLLGARLFADEPAVRARACEAWNFGPAAANARPVSELVEAIVAAWGEGTWRAEQSVEAPHEHTLLRLAIDKARAGLGWQPRWDLETAVARTVEWYQAFEAGDDMAGWCRRQIVEYGGLDR
jgi:CDP-glucose 4,6-dehydratase